MTIPKTYRLATPEEMEQMKKYAEEAERLYFESGLSDVPLIVDADRSAAAESEDRQEGQVVDSHLPLNRPRSTTSESCG
jgi:hypothetical protein